MDDALRERVEALERAVTDGDHDLSAVADEAAALDRLDTLESDVADLADRVEELEAATQALRGYVGNIRSVNTDVEQRADAALAKVEALERQLPETAASNGHALADAPADDERRETAEDADAAVDEWQWGTNGHADDPDGVRGNDAGTATHDDPATGSHDAQSPGSAPGAGPQAATAGADPHAPDTGGGNGPPSDGSGSLMANRTGWGAAGDGSDSHGAGTGHSTDAGHRSDTAQQTTRQPGDEHRCESCGRPHAAGESSASGHSPGTARTSPDAGTTDEPRTAGRTDQGAAHGPNHATGSRGVTGSRAGDSGEATPGAPTVEALAERDPPVTEDSAESADADVLPDGADDPLVGSEEGDRDAGTLQRIRDLL